MSLSDYKDFLSFSVWAGLWVNPMSDPTLLNTDPQPVSVFDIYVKTACPVLETVYSWGFYPKFGRDNQIVPDENSFENDGLVMARYCWIMYAHIHNIGRYLEMGWRLGENGKWPSFACVTPVHVSSLTWHLDVIVHLASCMNISNFPIYLHINCLVII